MKINLREVRPQLTKLIEELDETGPVSITKHGTVVAVLSRPAIDSGGWGHSEIKESPHPRPLPDVEETKRQQAARDALLNAMKKK